MNDLDICKRIAEIEGVDHSVNGEHVFYVVDGWPAGYNPLINDALCFRLMVKYRVSLFSHPSDLYSVTNYEHNQTLARDENPNRAICLAIIEAHKDE